MKPLLDTESSKLNYVSGVIQTTMEISYCKFADVLPNKRSFNPPSLYIFLPKFDAFNFKGNINFKFSM